MVQGQKVRVINTCPFDSILEVITSSICNFDDFAIFLEREPNGDCIDPFSMANKYAKTGPSEELYKMRGESICKYLFEDVKLPLFPIMNKQANVNRMFSFFCKKLHDSYDRIWYTGGFSGR